MDLPYWLRFAEAFGVGIVSPILIAIGGFFVWYRFIRQGKHDPRLQPFVAGSVAIRGNVAYIIATLSVINVGQVDVELDLAPSASGLLLLTRRQDDEGWGDDPELKYSVFPGQGVAQPGGTLEDQVWIELPYSDEVAVILELTITGYTITRPEGYTWKTVEVIALLDGVNFPQDG